MIDWNRWTYERARHHERLRSRIKRMPQKLVCQECGGRGEIVDDMIDGFELCVTCGWCEGIGYVLPYTRSLWLRIRRAEKKARKFSWIFPPS